MSEEMLNPVFELKINGNTEEIFMSFALLNLMASITGNPDNLDMIHINHELRTELLNAMLCLRSKSGRVTEVRTIEDVEISQGDFEALLEFGVDHLTGFFIRAMEKAVARSQKYQVKVQGLKDSSTGLKS